MRTVDLLVVGGGINGVGIARDAAGRGLSVLLCEKDDLASHTSSWSTKLIHGGLRYLEHREFRLVRESLIEREVLLNAAPHLISPLRFILPHHKGLRPGWMLRFGLFLYDNIGGRRALPGTVRRDLKQSVYGEPLDPEFEFGFEYTDCRTDDSRLVVLNAIDARERGAEIRTRTRCIGARRDGELWHVSMRNAAGEEETVAAKTLVNAAGPWVTSLFDDVEDVAPRKKLRLVKGSHIITKALYAHDRAYIFQNTDGRIVFAIPYVNGTTLIGTTDEPYEGDPASAEISEEETNYLLDSVSEYMRKPVTRDQVIGSFSGVRPLYDELDNAEASAVTRDYAFDIDSENGAPFLSIYGGKLTTYRKLAEHAVDKLVPWLPSADDKAWTRSESLPGGEADFAAWPAARASLRERFGFLPEAVFERMVSAYGDRLPAVLGDASSLEELGRDFGHGLFENELRYLIREEWALSADDVLWRRSKLGQIMSAEQIEAVGQFIRSETGDYTVAA
ncbi:glycerol-3-phosphate dehydrogenase [Parvularcula sp. ZS-1/3]|uniref:Glycerol-3-phosphate dehydrogenase n=1 Tax=Parvularcula mediterranea TaxID=2732508 RepID=A0A7Y3RLB5_9PROT|nr:glycerol-3-phosphate dehydrogenase [Parvularcula mediterranea]NNU16217.1 glycerol-3-phosphate dehydrogenase [Parvularcula mediterranea]